MSYENKLLQMKKMLGKKSNQTVEKPAFIKPEQPNYLHQWQQAGLDIVENDFGVLLKKEVRYALDYKHGDYELGELFAAMERWSTQQEDHPYALSLDETLVFFDTETTGLKGAGTHIFLLGFLEMQEEEFVLTQYVLADPSNEAAFLFESKLWQRNVTMITYNGKSFDWPQLEVRWTLNKQHIPKLKMQRQVDLLHSTKRLWKDDLQQMKLTQVEQDKLGFHRQGDIPGHLAPIIYFDAVKSGNATTLMKVLTHNEWDLLSLITLYIHSTKLLLDEVGQESATTYTNIGKWFGDLKQKKTGTEILTAVTEQFSQSEAGFAYYYLAFELKRSGDYTLAVNAFQTSLPALPMKKQVQAYEQLAMLYEHQLKDYKRAHENAEAGMAVVKRVSYAKDSQQQRQLQNWNKRLNRLQGKLRK
ncbi:ribonuclease H-like domain-containing protein [Solibacillus sp. FSL K6-1523]|uniref:ribonuclease H-like domain-containing protein n=1 Tax=Solibacillus sp. FSL K6-1523 TaxID=2921471 RepID=UPI0030F5F68A